MDLLSGPKALISSAIAETLAEYFVVGVDHIESSLLTDTKIVLKDARLKPQHSSIHKNSFGKTTDICVTGFVREASFTWSWDFMPNEGQSWIKDPVLEIGGCKFKVRLTERDAPRNTNGGVSGVGTASSTNGEHKESTNDVQSELGEQTAQTSTIEEKIEAFLAEQAALIVNALTLKIIDFDITVEMPSPTIVTNTPVSVFEDPQEAGNIEIIPLETSSSSSRPDASTNGKSNANNDYIVSLKVGFHQLKILSNARSDLLNSKILNEEISFSSLFINVTETFYHTVDAASSPAQRREVVCKTYPLQKPFSYIVEISRTHGERFSDIGRGLVVRGGQQLEFDEETMITATDRGGLSFHLSRPQMEAFGQLSGLVLAPREDTVKTASSTETTKTSNHDEAATLMGDVSTFDFSFDSVAVDLMGNKLSATGINIDWLADGTDLSAKAGSFCFVEETSDTKRSGISITCSNIFVTSIRPCIEVVAGSVIEVYIPYIVELRTPVENVRARLVGETWTFDIDSFDGYLPAPELELEGAESNDEDQVVAFPMVFNAKRVFLARHEDEETEVAFSDVELLLNPRFDQHCTDLACSIGSMESKLASANRINTCMVIPGTERDKDTFRNFALSLDSLSVTAGYTIQDWIKTFRIGGRWRKKKDKVDDTIVFKLPYASVAPLRTRITYNALRVVALKETAFLAKAYKGNKGTTAKDLLDFYVSQCLARTPYFLQNAELLGINVKNAGAFSLGATLLTGHIAPFVGVAAVVGVDAVRGSIEAGKRSRRAEEGEAARMGDFFRGIGYSAVEATQRGKLRRGCEDGQGNVIDWMVGATVNTGDYIGNNKDSLGSAGGAGAGVFVGTMLGGPVGALIGGVVGGMTTGTAIRRIEKRVKKAIQQREANYEESKLKPGQLALSPDKDTPNSNSST